MGALIGGASAQECDLLYKFGYDIGLAFQIADDWLDTYGDPAIFGKAIGGDILNNKKTWLLTRAFEKAGLMRSDLLAAMEMPMNSDEEKAAKISAVKGIYDALGIGEEAKQEIARLHGRGVEAVESLNLPQEAALRLHNYASKLIGRNK